CLFVSSCLLEALGRRGCTSVPLVRKPESERKPERTEAERMLGVIVIFLVLGLLIFLGVTWYESSKAEYPPGIANPKFLRTTYTFVVGSFILGKILDKLGIWNVAGPLNFIGKLSKPKLEG
ncbi:unnamed protein product, partial [Ranitomeya imitator]